MPERKEAGNERIRMPFARGIVVVIVVIVGNDWRGFPVRIEDFSLLSTLHVNLPPTTLRSVTLRKGMTALLALWMFSFLGSCL